LLIFQNHSLLRASQFSKRKGFWPKSERLTFKKQLTFKNKSFFKSSFGLNMREKHESWNQSFYATSFVHDTKWGRLIAIFNLDWLHHDITHKNGWHHPLASKPWRYFKCQSLSKEAFLGQTLPTKKLISLSSNADLSQKLCGLQDVTCMGKV
jgi:hypothetical protein